MRSALPALSLLAAGMLVPALASASSCKTGTADQSAPAGGQCAIADYNPPGSNGGVGEAVVDNGQTVTLHGTSVVGTGYNGNTTVPANTVNVISGTFDSSALVIGPQSVAVSARNPATGTTVVFKAFDSASIAGQSNLATPVNQFEDVNGDMYYKASLGRVENTGGEPERQPRRHANRLALVQFHRDGVQADLPDVRGRQRQRRQPHRLALAQPDRYGHRPGPAHARRQRPPDGDRAGDQPTPAR